MNFKCSCFAGCLLLLSSLSLFAADPASDPVLAALLFNDGKYGEAAAILEQAAVKGGLAFRDEVLLGVCYIKLGQLPRSRTILDKLAGQKADDAFLHFAFANLEFEAGNFQAAYTHFKQAVSLGYDPPVCKAGMTAALVNRGVELFKAGNSDGAREQFLQAYRLDKTAVAVLKNLGLLELKVKNYRQAALYLEQALEEDKENAEIIALLLSAYKKSGNREAQLKNLRKLAGVLPYNGDVQAELGLFYEQRGNTGAARKAFALAEEYGTDEPYVYHRLAALATDREERLYLVHQAIGKAIYRISAIRMEAAGKIGKNEKDFTAEEVQEIRELSKQAEEPLAILEDSLSELQKLFDDPAALESDLQRLIDWYPAGLELQTTLGKLYTDTGQWAKAENHWQAVLKKHPTSDVSQQGMGYCLEMTGRLENAAVYYLRALDLSPEKADYYTDLERLYGKLKRLPDLTRQLQERSLRDKRNPLLFERLVKLEEQLGFGEEASAHKQRLEELRKQ